MEIGAGAGWILILKSTTHLLGLCVVAMVIVTPIHKVPDYTPIFIVLTSFNKTNGDCIVRKFLEEASTGVVFEVCCLDGIQE